MFIVKFISSFSEVFALLNNLYIQRERIMNVLFLSFKICIAVRTIMDGASRYIYMCVKKYIIFSKQDNKKYKDRIKERERQNWFFQSNNFMTIFYLHLFHSIARLDVLKILTLTQRRVNGSRNQLLCCESQLQRHMALFNTLQYI